MSALALNFDISDLLAALDEMKTDFVIYGGENALIYANKSARSHWPVLYEELEKGVHRRDATIAQVRFQYPHLTDGKAQEVGTMVYEATLNNQLFDIETSDDRIVQTVHQSISDHARLAMSIDVTDLRAREEELRTAKRLAEKANEAKSDFLAKMSHEIRTPMNGVLGIAELLRHTELDDMQALYVDTICRSGQALMKVINDVLDFSKIEAGRLEIDRAPFRLLSVVDDVVDLMRPVADEKGLGFAFHACDEAAALGDLMGDAGRLRQVLLNIVGNALKFTEEGEVTIAVRVAPHGDGDGGGGGDGGGEGPAGGGAETRAIRIEVADTGVGVGENELETIFEKFAQSAASDGSAGTGLGLSISRTLVDMMGGRLSVASVLGEGSCFRLDLALAAAPTGAAAPAAAAAHRAA